MIVAAAAVAAFGDLIIVRAQDLPVGRSFEFDSVEYRYANINPIEVLSLTAGEPPVVPVPATSQWGLIALAAALAAIGPMLLRRRSASAG